MEEQAEYKTKYDYDTTSITIAKSTNKKIESFCKLHKKTKKDFAAAAILFFEKTGFNPFDLTAQNSEIQRMSNRIEDLVKIVRKMEKESIKPIETAASGALSKATEGAALTDKLKDGLTIFREQQKELLDKQNARIEEILLILNNLKQ